MASGPSLRLHSLKSKRTRAYDTSMVDYCGVMGPELGVASGLSTPSFSSKGTRATRTGPSHPPIKSANTIEQNGEEDLRLAVRNRG